MPHGLHLQTNRNQTECSRNSKLKQCQNGNTRWILCRLFLFFAVLNAVYSAVAAAAAAEYIDGTDKLNNEKNALLVPDVYDICHFLRDRERTSEHFGFRLWWCVCMHVFMNQSFSVCVRRRYHSKDHAKLQGCPSLASHFYTHTYIRLTFTIGAISWSCDFRCIFLPFAVPGLGLGFGFGLDTIRQNTNLFACSQMNRMISRNGAIELFVNAACGRCDPFKNGQPCAMCM